MIGLGAEALPPVVPLERTVHVPRTIARIGSPGPRLAVSSLFLITGLLAGTWIGRIPAVTSRLGLDAGQIGSLLLFFSVGSLVSFQVIGRLIARYGSPWCARAAGLLTCAALPLLALAPERVSFGMALWTVGFAIGATSVAMNAQAVTVQRLAARPIMHSLHGLFTLGMLVGSLIGGALASLEIGPVAHFAASGAIVAIWTAAAATGLVADESTGDEEKSKGLAFPPRALWPIGALAFCAGLGEGSMYDWSALYVHGELGASEGTGALAFAAFSGAMLTGRFAGDRMITRLGPVTTMRGGSLVAAVGLIGGLATTTVVGAFLGFAVVGLGLSMLMPLLYSAAGSHPEVASFRGVAAVATMGFTGLLAGPPVLGTLADATSLRAALGSVAVICAIMATLASAVRSPSHEPIHAGQANGQADRVGSGTFSPARRLEMVNARKRRG